MENNFHKQRVLVTGANGFIGHNLIKSLHKLDYSVRGTSRHLSRKSYANDFVSIDNITSETDWSSALININTVVHLAARAHVIDKESAKSLSAFREVNSDGTLRLAQQAAEAGVRRFIFISSIGVNGNESHKPFSEQDPPAPQEPYAVSKMEAEDRLRSLADETGLEVVIIRPPLVYGPNAPGNFGNLLHWIQRGIPLPLGSVTDNRRSFVALENLVDFIATCIEHPAAANQTFLVADGEDVSTAMLLKLVGQALNQQARLLPVPVPLLRAGALLLGKQEMARRLLTSLQVDASKAHRLLDWTPPLSLEAGLQQTANALEPR